MEKRRYAIGVDFGTLSARAVLADVEDGSIVASVQQEYARGVLDAALPDGTPLPENWALFDPEDYWQVLCQLLSEMAEKIDPAQIVGIGIDCTSSTTLPTDAQGTPLCRKPGFEHCPHAFGMMWKHHGAVEQAERMTRLAQERREGFLSLYGGAVNAEWVLPKLLQIFEEAPEVYAAAAHELEAMDWLNWRLTGRLNRSAMGLGYKAFYQNGSFPAEAYFAALHPGFASVCRDKLSGPVFLPGECVGGLTEEKARMLGLLPGTAVAAGSIDAHAGVPAAGIMQPGTLLSMIGTSTCHIVAGEKPLPLPGVSGVVTDGVLPGMAWYEAGQSCVGDSFAWFVRQCVPEAVSREAGERRIPLQALLTEKAARLHPGESGLLALDWWNGNRSVLANAQLSGVILGLTLKTRTEEIYRALLESTAYGAREIIDGYRNGGVPIDEVRVSGGIALKNPLAMQIYADVLQLPLSVTEAAQGPALGSAIYGAAAAGVYDSVQIAAEKMGSGCAAVYRPVEANVRVYEALYQEYHRLHDYFGRGGNDVMPRLREIAGQALQTRRPL